MTPFEHRYILSLILLSLHCILLLPVVFPPTSPCHGLLDGDSEQPPPKSDKSILSSLHLKCSVSSGIFGFLVVVAAKRLVGKIPLPKDPRRKWLAESLEWSILFLLGCMEEVWRWWLVRLVVRLGGGGGGFGASIMASMSAGVGQNLKILGPTGIEFDGAEGVWEGVYFMGWIWSFLESGFAWWRFRPYHESERSRLNARRRRSMRQRGDNYNEASDNSQSCRSQEGMRIVPPTSASGSESVNPFFRGFRTPIWGNEQETKIAGSNVSLPIGQTQPQIDIVAASVGQPTQAQFTFGQRGFTFGSQRRASLGPLDISPPSPAARPFESRIQDLERGVTESHVHDSANDFGDDEDESSDSEDSDLDSSSARSSSESVRSQAATPLLSSSLPYDPSSEHPHHEQQALLHHQYRRMSYQALAQNNPVSMPSTSNDEEDDDEVQQILRDHDEALTVPPAEGQGLSPQRPRAYPSYPSYSASYNHSHFQPPPLPLPLPPSPSTPPFPLPSSPASPPPHPRPRLLTYFSSRSVRRSASISALSSPQSQFPPLSLPRCRRASRISSRHYVRMIYGVTVNSLPIYLPVMWRLGSTLRILANVLLFAWFPSLFYKGAFQFWTFLVLLFLATMKGWYTVDWVCGGAARSGILKVSSVMLAGSLITYLAALGLWGVICC